MESFFFNTTNNRYKRTSLLSRDKSYFDRVDISNGVVFFEGKLFHQAKEIKIKNLDRLVMIVMVKEGIVTLQDYISAKKELLRQGDVGIYCSSRQDISLQINKTSKTDVFILFIADFFMKRYLSGSINEPIDFLYSKTQKEFSLEKIDIQPIDALTLYIVNRLLNVFEKERMQSIRAEHRVIEFMIHRFTILDILDEKISKEDLLLAKRAKVILLDNFVSPPTIRVLAHLCATNESKLKKIFKKVYKTTLHSYVQKLRLEKANYLLKEQIFTIGEIAKEVGYKHQGYFSKLFFDTYGVYPRELI
jgi:AraC-like DNA-binding protein